MLSELGERIRLARKRRKLSTAVVAQRAGIARTTLYKVETGTPGVTLGSYVRVMATLGLEGDFVKLAADDKVGRKLQDLALEPASSKARTSRTAGKQRSAPATSSASEDTEDT